MKHGFKVLLGLAALAATSICSAATFGGGLTVRSAAGEDQFCMDAQGDRQGNGTQVYLWRCHGRENQRWAITRNADGTSTFVGTGGFCLDVTGNGKADGTPVQLYQCHYGPNQRFRLFDDGRIQEVSSGKCLMVLPQWGGPIDRDHDRDAEWERRKVWERWHARDYEHLRFAVRDGAPIVIDDCQPRGLQVWHPMQ